MRLAACLSFLFHAAFLALLAWPGSFFEKKPLTISSPVIPLTVVPISAITASPPKKRVEEKKINEHKQQQVRKSIPEEIEIPEPVLEKEPMPEPKVEEALPEPKPEPMPEPKPKPEPKHPPKKTASTEKKKPSHKAKKKKSEDDFLSVLKTVEDLPQESSVSEKDEKGIETNNIADKLSVSELDALRQQLSKCWALPAGAREAAKLVVEIDVMMNPDATVQRAHINSPRSDPFFRAMAESARRALFHPDCTPLRLPKDKFDEWQTFTITFNPHDLFE